MKRYASVCDGISACRVAWAPLGWQCRWVSEIDQFCNAVCEHHYPGQTNLGDMEKIGDAEPIELLVGGTPCQSFSVAGLRKGMADPRGNLALVFLRLADRLRPRWVVWENVPGILSSNKGRDFGAFLGAMGQLGYGWSYRVLDAQYVRVDGHERAVPQRRRRVFVVGHSGGWQRAAAVLFERACLCGHPAPRREAGQGTARDVAPSLRGGGPGGNRVGDTRGQYPVVAMCLNAGGTGRIDAESETFIAHTLRGEGHDAGEDGTGRGTPIIPILEAGKRCGTRDSARDGIGVGNAGDPMFTLQSGAQHAIAFTDLRGRGSEVRINGDVAESLHCAKGVSEQQAVCFQTRIGRNGRGQPKDVVDALTSCEAGTHADSKPHVAGPDCGVRRLTPLECERLQAFPDGYTLVHYRGKPAADAPRYKALGNSMACNVMRWIGRRIDMVDSLAPPSPT